MAITIEDSRELQRFGAERSTLQASHERPNSDEAIAHRDTRVSDFERIKAELENIRTMVSAFVADHAIAGAAAIIGVKSLVRGANKVKKLAKKALGDWQAEAGQQVRRSAAQKARDHFFFVFASAAVTGSTRSQSG